jgi:3-deoxy-D-manno-octulosonic-acid transferase
LKIQFPSYKILLTFFSPSGYEIRKNYALADAIFYLPMDGKKNAAQFIQIVNPSLVIWVKYEYWYYYLTTLKQKNIPLVLVSAIFRAQQPFFKWYGNLWKKILLSFNQIFVQDENSVNLLSKIGITTNVILAGDTRFDRVIDIAEKKINLPQPIVDFCTTKKIIIAGSTWEDDEQLLVHYARMHSDVKFIIAPHEIDEDRLVEIETLFINAVRYSDFIAGKEAPQIIIIDNIGMLSSLYALAKIVYVGGGFNDSGIHNILEAAVYGKPIVFATEYDKFKEAIDLVEEEAAFSIENALELEALLDKLFSDDDLCNSIEEKSKKYVYNKKGATEKIVQFLKQISF